MCGRAIHVDAGLAQHNTVRLINIATAGFFSLDMLLRCIADGLLLTPEAYLTVHNHPPTTASPAGKRMPSCPVWQRSIRPGEILWARLPAIREQGAGMAARGEDGAPVAVQPTYEGVRLLAAETTPHAGPGAAHYRRPDAAQLSPVPPGDCSMCPLILTCRRYMALLVRWFHEHV